MQRGDQFGQHAHLHAQLSWPSVGLLYAEIDATRWTLSPALAFWVPPEAPHDIGALRPAQLHNVYLHPERVPKQLSSPAAVSMTPLLRDLLMHLADGSIDDEHRHRTEEVFLDLLQPASSVTTVLPSPLDPCALEVARALRADPSNDDTLAAWGRRVGCSARTLARRFHAETGLTFRDWRAQVRLRAALDHLADGVPPSTVAGLVGYHTTSAFVAAFRRATGETPGRLQKQLASRSR